MCVYIFMLVHFDIYTKFVVLILCMHANIQQKTVLSLLKCAIHLCNQGGLREILLIILV